MIQYFIRTVRLFTLLAVLVAVFVAAMTLAYAVPDRLVLANATASLTLLEIEGPSPRPFAPVSTVLSNYDDAIMINAAVPRPSGSPLRNAMTNTVTSFTETGSPITGLRDKVSGRSLKLDYPYNRYWHGYEVALRPLLALFDYGTIRYLNLLAMTAMAFVVFGSVRNSLGTGGVAALAIALSLTSFYLIPMSLHFSSVTYISLGGLFAGLELERRGLLAKVEWEYFALIGALIAFAELLTVPLLSVGIPLVGLMLVRRKGGASIRNNVSTAFFALLFWGVGYATTLIAKWLVAGAVLGKSLIAEGISEIALRAGATPVPEAPGGVAEALSRNTRFLAPIPLSGAFDVALLSAGLLVVAVILILVMRRNAARNATTVGDVARRSIPVLLVGMLPFVWYALINQHSATHPWNTYHLLAMTLFAIFGIALVKDEPSVRSGDVCE